MIPEIPENYLIEEEREGFLITEKMKRSWATKLKLLCMIDDICSRFGLRWYADYGTLLGAVRHRGFIPWDDDMDISMPRRDYDIALQILRQELPDECNVSFFGKTDFVVPWSYVNNRRRTDLGDDPVEAAITEKYYGNPFRDCIDIYPLDNVPADPEERSVFLEIHETIFEAIQNYEVVRREGRLEEYADVIRELTGQQLPVDENFRPCLCALQESLAKLYPREQSVGVDNIANMAHHARDRYRSYDIYEDTVMLPFEMIEVPVPIGYEKILRNNFGDGWTAPLKNAASHDYPFYREQEELIREHKKG